MNLTCDLSLLLLLPMLSFYTWMVTGATYHHRSQWCSTWWLTGSFPHVLVKFIFMPKTFTNFLQKASIMMWVVTFTAVCRSINNGGDCRQPILDNQLCIWQTKMCCIRQKMKIKGAQIDPYKNMWENQIESKDKMSKNWPHKTSKIWKINTFSFPKIHRVAKKSPSGQKLI